MMKGEICHVISTLVWKFDMSFIYNYSTGVNCVKRNQGSLLQGLPD